VPTVLKSGSLKFLEISGPIQACNGIVLPFSYYVNFENIVLNELISKGVSCRAFYNLFHKRRNIPVPMFDP
jgi:hypothetical protein